MKDAKELAKSFDNVNFIEFIKSVQKDSYNQGIYDAANNATVTNVMVEYTGVRAGGSYAVSIVDTESILRLLEK